MKKKMMLKFDGDVVAKHDELFAQGFFGLLFLRHIGHSFCINIYQKITNTVTV